MSTTPNEFSHAVKALREQLRLALLVAESKPDQKELMIRLVEHFVLLTE